MRADTQTTLLDRLSRDTLLAKYRTVRSVTEELTEPLETEDYIIQAMENVSPTKWHLAHVSWFFEAFVLKKAYQQYQSLHPQYHHLFNSYYLQTGEPFTRHHRGLITRPTVAETYEFRSYVDDQMEQLFTDLSDTEFAEIAPVIEIGLNHEQQHQELIVTDIKYNLSRNPLAPVYKNRSLGYNGIETPQMGWNRFEEGLYEIGFEGEGFSYDNEHPRHKRYLQSYEIGNRLVTNEEYLAFMEDGGYQDSALWLSDGYAAIEQHGWQAPLYWNKLDGAWMQYTLSGMREVHPAEPVTHISYYEADAFARWYGARLANEAEWEVASETAPIAGNFVDERNFHPMPLTESGDGLHQLFGDTWEWTQSAYDPYPGYEPLPGALGEYNGKFMCSQYVLRGGSCATSQNHTRRTYRNFFYPDARWQFSGIRLARTIS